MDISDPDQVHAATAEDRSLAVQTEGLSKSYGDFWALSDCNLTVPSGEIFGLLGPNGAGKTTLIRLLLGYVHATRGRATVVGSDPDSDSVAVRRKVSYLPGDARLPRHMRGRGVLHFFSQMHPLGDYQRSLAIAERLELDLSRHVAFMSTGMRQKLALAVVLGPQTPLLILDEPTANLDPTVRSEVLQLVLEARREGRTVMFSSHVLSEIEQTCDRVAFLRKGALVRRLMMNELFQRHQVIATTDATNDDSWSIPEPLAELIQRVEINNGQVRIDTAGDLAGTLSWLGTLPIHNVRIEPLGLQSVYHEVHLGQLTEAEAAA